MYATVEVTPFPSFQSCGSHHYFNVSLDLAQRCIMREWHHDSLFFQFLVIPYDTPFLSYECIASAVDCLLALSMCASITIVRVVWKSTRAPALTWCVMQTEMSP
jgi:hypothetical protein